MKLLLLLLIYSFLTFFYGEKSSIGYSSYLQTTDLLNLSLKSLELPDDWNLAKVFLDSKQVNVNIQIL